MAMAKVVNDAELWLPSQFPTDADILGDKENNKNGVNSDLDASFGFPSEFPYEFYSFEGSGSALSSPVESVAGSTETDSSGSDDVDEDFFAALTRRLSQSSLYETPKLTVPTCCDRDKTGVVEKTHGLARSPQSTLSGIGSWSAGSAVSGDRSPILGSQVPSPPTTPFPAKNDLAWDVIYAAAGQVARMKIHSEVSKYDFQNGAFLGAPRPAIAKTQPPSMYPNQSFLQVQAQQSRQQQCASVWGRQAKADWLAQQQQKMQSRAVRNVGYETAKCGRPASLSQSAWPPLHVQAHNYHQVQLNGSGSRAAVNGGSVARRGCSGTGVFLPRQYGNPPESRKKTCCAPVLLPSKVVHGRNLKIDDLNAVANQTGFSGAFATEYDAFMARRNALLMQQQRLSVRPEEAVNHDLRLPQDWIY